ncbi:hypothetical protein RFI_04260 [Reticulomyxa filosa]|uniref:Uncharacterized protein n=1 Tax=Reticulomyxa filosa TaxID=46433 RepID=X6P403_RETFI|nr:hypothetical protein RFI_04260 [Reticulomyxa filosa]|eukprot:ETO32853.1 hypothetical protein RFI_04260 [Reticulomyxa filosa]
MATSTVKYLIICKYFVAFTKKKKGHSVSSANKVKHAQMIRAEKERQSKKTNDVITQIRRNLELMLQLKNEKSEEKKNSISSIRYDLTNLYKKTLPLISYLKSSGEYSLNRQDLQQEVISACCEEINERTLAVKNCQYEKANVLKNIAICRDYKPKNPIPQLIPLEQFLQLNNDNLPPDIQSDPHLLYIERLKFELLQRKQF